MKLKPYYLLLLLILTFLIGCKKNYTLEELKQEVDSVMVESDLYSDNVLLPNSTPNYNLDISWTTKETSIAFIKTKDRTQYLYNNFVSTKENLASYKDDIQHIVITLHLSTTDGELTKDFNINVYRLNSQDMYISEVKDMPVYFTVYIQGIARFVRERDGYNQAIIQDETGYIYVESNESIYIGEYYCIEGILYNSYIRATKVSPGYTKRPYIDEAISIYRAKNVNATIKDIGNHYKIYGMLRIDDNENLLYIEDKVEGIPIAYLNAFYGSNLNNIYLNATTGELKNFINRYVSVDAYLLNFTPTRNLLVDGDINGIQLENGGEPEFADDELIEQIDEELNKLQNSYVCDFINLPSNISNVLISWKSDGGVIGSDGFINKRPEFDKLVTLDATYTLSNKTYKYKLNIIVEGYNEYNIVKYIVPNSDYYLASIKDDEYSFITTSSDGAHLKDTSYPLDSVKLYLEENKEQDYSFFIYYLDSKNNKQYLYIDNNNLLFKDTNKTAFVLINGILTNLEYNKFIVRDEYGFRVIEDSSSIESVISFVKTSPRGLVNTVIFDIKKLKDANYDFYVNEGSNVIIDNINFNITRLSSYGRSIKLRTGDESLQSGRIVNTTPIKGCYKISIIIPKNMIDYKKNIEVYGISENEAVLLDNIYMNNEIIIQTEGFEMFRFELLDIKTTFYFDEIIFHIDKED